MPFSVAELRQYRLVLDTGPLLDFLLHPFMEQTNWGNVGHLSAIRDSHAAQRFGRFLSLHRPIIVSDGILVELEHHRQRRELPLPHFWRITREELLTIGIDEAPLRLMELPQVDLYRFGRVDANLLTLGATRGLKPAAIVTADNALYQACLERQIRPLWIDEILSLDF